MIKESIKAKTSSSIKSDAGVRNVFKTFFDLIMTGLSSPIKSIKHFNFIHITTLFKAIKNESPQQILNNFKRLLAGEVGQFTNDNIKFPEYSKISYLKEKQAAFDQFLHTKSIFDFSVSDPVVTIIMVLYNQAPLSFSCLNSIKKHVKLPIQLIIIDNNSTDETPQLLEQIKGAIIIRNKKNFHFIHACNQAIDHINTEYTLFINNDVELIEDSISIAFEQLSSNKDYGAIGGKIILPNGMLQEAGNIVWNDGTCLGYGRGQSPHLLQFNFMRNVDYCSAAFLMTRTELFKKHGGFDPLFKPAYYEETDYCLWLHEKGFKVIYHPQIAIRHFEFGSNSEDHANLLIKKNHKTFYKKHQLKLTLHQTANKNNISVARFAASSQNQKRILYVDARIPHRDDGAGFPRSNTILQCMIELGYQVSIYPLNHSTDHSREEMYRDIDNSIEIIYSKGFEGFKRHLQSHSNIYNLLWISRPHNLNAFNKLLSKDIFNGDIIYDCEAIYAERKIHKMKLEGVNLDQNQVDEMIGKELQLTHFAHKIVTVSDADAIKFKNLGKSNTTTLGHLLKLKPNKYSYGERKDLLFVGNLDHDDSPNVDSIIWFTNEVWPILKSNLPELKFHIIGSPKSLKIAELKMDDVIIHGKVEDTSSFYNKCRVFVAPTRFAAGIPYKIHKAASHSLPVISTDLLGRQLGWKHQEEIMLSTIDAEEFAKACMDLYNSASLWEHIQENASEKLANESSKEKYLNSLRQILKQAID